MEKLGIFVLDQPGGSLVADWTQRSQGGSFATNEHGFESYRDRILMPRREAFNFYSRQPYHLVIGSTAGNLAWEGRLEDVAIVDDGLDVVALGYQRALSDVPYTALWSDSHYARWRVQKKEDAANVESSRYEQDNSNRLYIAPRKGEVFGNASQLGGWLYSFPHSSQKQIVAILYDYEMVLPSNWVLRAATFSPFASVDTVTATGVLQTGSKSLSFTAANIIAVQIYNNTGANSTITADTGANYAKITNIRVKTTTASTVTADTIVADLATFVNGINPTQLQSQTAINVETASIDLEDAIYEDMYPSDILNALTDQAVAGERWVWSVWHNRLLNFHERGSRARVWYTDIVSLTVNGSLNELYNSVYGTYQNGYNETERTATVSDAESIEAYGITRRAVASERSQAQATARRDVLLAQRADLTPRVSLEMRGLFDAGGASYPLWNCRAGDVMVIRNLPATYSPVVDKIRQFYISATDYDMKANVLRPTPELDIPGLEVLVAGLGQRTPFAKLGR